jgi:methyl-accepting chemotaxis protein
LKKLSGNAEIEDSLQELDKLTQEEARMASAELLKITHSVDDGVKGVDKRVQEFGSDGQDIGKRVHAVDDGMQGIGSNVKDMTDKVQSVDDKVQDVYDEVQAIDDKLDQVNRTPSSSFLLFVQNTQTPDRTSTPRVPSSMAFSSRSLHHA